MELLPLQFEPILIAALGEDLGAGGDVTTDLTVPADARATAIMYAKADGVLAGIALAERAFQIIEPRAIVTRIKSDGARVQPGDVLLEVRGAARGLLTAERVALNFVQRMSGTATMTARFVELVQGTKARIVETRKTTPGLRALEKYAVRVGGGHNHRIGLSDGILIKDNHLAAGGGVAACIAQAKAFGPHPLRIEVECKTLTQVEEALTAGADILLLDNMPLEMLRTAVATIGGRAITEASGGVNLQTVAAIAQTGVDIISVGALTHSAPALDISLDFREDTLGLNFGTETNEDKDSDV